MIAFLHWLRSALLGMLDWTAKFALFVVVLVVILIVVGLARGDGLPGRMVLTLDLRKSIADSADAPSFGLVPRPVTVMNLLFALREAERDRRVAGLLVRLGGGGISVAEAEEIGTAIAEFRSHGKFVVAQATDFSDTGLGDYLTVAGVDQIWMQPRATFAVAGVGGAEFFLRGLFDKIQAAPEMVKRAEYKSAADMYMEKTMTDADHEQLMAVMQSWYDEALAAIAADRRLSLDTVHADFEASPQLSEDALRERLIDKTGYDDDARAAAIARAGAGAKPVIMSDYIAADGGAPGFTRDAPIAVITASGDIVDGTADSSLIGANSGIASDDLSDAIRRATRDKDIKAIVLRVDSPGGSVSASDQILDAVRKAQAAGKKVVVSMGPVAASGGYYISASADGIVAEPGTLTGSIGVLTGKVSVDKSFALAGVGTSQVGVGRNVLMDSSFSPYTPDQLAALNREADAVYGDFLHNVSTGRKLPLATVETIARGRVWTGADAHARGLVNQLGGFWTAADLAARLAGIGPNEVAFKSYTSRRGFLGSIVETLRGAGMDVSGLESLAALVRLPIFGSLLGAVKDLPHNGVELRAINLPR